MVLLPVEVMQDLFLVVSLDFERADDLSACLVRTVRYTYGT